MSDWLHCNSCYRQLQEPQRKLALSTCGHIYCKECICKAPNECRICKQKVGFVGISSQMAKDQQVYFTSPMEMLQRYAVGHASDLNMLKKVIDFQNKHRSHLMNYLREKQNKKMSEEYNKLHMSLRKIENDVKQLEESRAALFNENAYLKQLVESKSSRNVSSELNKTSNWRTPSLPSSMESPFVESRSDFRIERTPSPKISPGRLSINTPPIGGRLSTATTPTASLLRENSSHAEYLPSTTYSSRVSPQTYDNIRRGRISNFQPIESRFNSLASSSHGRSVIPTRFISINSLRK